MLSLSLVFLGRRIAHTSILGLMALSVGACANQSLSHNFLASPEAAVAATKPGKAERKATGNSESAVLVAKAQSNPSDVKTAIEAARALRAEGNKPAALALIEKAAAASPKNTALMREAGMLALELGQISKSEPLLRKAAASSTDADWQTHSALGAALASNGKHAEAQKHFAKALELAPDQPAVLNNLALSYALDGKSVEAERVLRIAASANGKPLAPHIRQNLALVLGARGKLAEAQSVAAAADKDTARSNSAYLRSLAERAAGGGSSEEVPLRSAAADSKRDLAKPYMLGVPTGQ